MPVYHQLHTFLTTSVQYSQVPMVSHNNLLLTMHINYHLAYTTSASLGFNFSLEEDGFENMTRP